jgi:hypothetical protein
MFACVGFLRCRKEKNSVKERNSKKEFCDASHRKDSCIERCVSDRVFVLDPVCSTEKAERGGNQRIRQSKRHQSLLTIVYGSRRHRIFWDGADTERNDEVISSLSHLSLTM